MAPEILKLPAVRARVVPISVSAYEQICAQGGLPEGVELIRGLVIEKMPKSPLHAKLAKRLYDHFLRALPAGFIVFQERPMRLRDSEPEPDITIVQGCESDFDLQHPVTAELAIEVAISSVEIDRLKADLYAEAGIPEYWIVLAEEQKVEIFTEPVAGVYQRRRELSVGGTLSAAGKAGISVPVSMLFA